MAKYFIFDNISKGLTKLADTDAKKDKFLIGQNIYTAVEASDTDYTNIKNGLKKISLTENGTALIENFTQDDADFFKSSETIDQTKEKIKAFIQSEIYGWENIESAESSQMCDALRQINVDSLTAVPTGTVLQWILSQPGAPTKRPFEI